MWQRPPKKINLTGRENYVEREPDPQPQDVIKGDY